MTPYEIFFSKNLIFVPFLGYAKLPKTHPQNSLPLKKIHRQKWYQNIILFNLRTFYYDFY
jgi:hypothetical protein